jgi:hypothetical protein
VGGTASHLLSGHTRAHQVAEEHAAAWLGFERALLFSSGYLANLAVVTALAGRGATLYADRLNHACLNDAARLSGARLRRYQHADLDTKRRLWNGVFDYDLNLFAPGGPEASPETAFVAVQPSRAMYMKAYGMGGTTRWTAS